MAARRLAREAATDSAATREIALLGAECIEVGPVNASIHQVDERIALAELEVLPGLYLRLAERFFA